jgi:hypothetical protein
MTVDEYTAKLAAWPPNHRYAVALGMIQGLAVTGCALLAGEVLRIATALDRLDDRDSESAQARHAGEAGRAPADQERADA